MKLFIPLFVCCYFAATEFAIDGRVPLSLADFESGLLFMVFLAPIFLAGAVLIAILAKYSERFRRTATALPTWVVGLLSLIAGISGYVIGHILVARFGPPAF